ncbi:hypothetical protein DOTSEDRAFT_71440 [Dothistroma septosporum NZE10]|uniref:Uncharacterized protein n=1 Tax=Dothistroma septosporum (strain NZE10 / CBS 128990) TaxID=675120 RepID=N1PS37_DOTSN|nr:hypothetical protein DOTSEDRAFT_71440 [Dothistroma septosporum NZE10]
MSLPPSDSGRRPLGPIAESPTIRLYRNTSIPRATADSSAEKGHLSSQSTVLPPRRRSNRALTRSIADVEPPRRNIKRPRSQESPISTPRKARKLVHESCASAQSTPESVRYDSGIEMTPESAIKLHHQEDIDSRPSSPCCRKSTAKLGKRQRACDRELRQLKERTEHHQSMPPRSSQEIASKSRHDEAQCPDDCPQSLSSPRQGCDMPQFTGDSYTKTAPSNSQASALCMSSSDIPNVNDTTSIDPQTLWQPTERREDIMVLLSILGETVVQQQRQRTILQRWLRNHDDHLLFWLNYGGSSSPSDYLRWTKRICSHRGLEDV